jgi:hypothetical protein
MSNSHEITGVIFAIEFSEISGKKDPSQKYPKYLFTLEVSDERDMSKKGQKGYKTVTTFPKFEAFGMDLSQFAKGDLVQVRFRAEGVFLTGKDGKEFHLNKNVITYMKYSDLDQGHPNHKGKITVESMSDINELGGKSNESVFKGPSFEEDELSGLPF